MIPASARAPARTTRHHRDSPAQYRARSTSLVAEVQKLKAANPDVWMPTSYQTDAILFVKHSQELDYNPRMIMAQNAGHIASDFVAAVGEEAEGTMSRAPFATDLIEAHRYRRSIRRSRITIPRGVTRAR